MVRVRFAPSPTGLIHLGNARTALFNWLFARHHGGVFLLRIEDTDVIRSEPRYTQLLMDDLRWLGIDWQEGPDVGGPYGPYLQSQRLSIYRDFTERLIKEGRAYPCYCTQSELEDRRKVAIARGRPPRYDNRCRGLSEAERKAFEAQGKKPSLRFLIRQGKLAFQDAIRGKCEFDLSMLGDFVIMKADGTPSFHLAVVVDDALMKITHVIRGEDHLSNTPLHLLLFEALGFPCPHYAHLPLIAGEEGDLLSKRAGAFSIQDYRKLGYLPEALVNYMLLLGWSPGQRQEKLTMAEAIEKFSLEHISRSPAHFDPKKLDWLAAQYIRQADLDRLTELIFPFLPAQAKGVERTKLNNLVGAVRSGLANLSQVAKETEWFFGEPIVGDSQRRDLSSDKAQIILAQTLEALERPEGVLVQDFKGYIQQLAERSGMAVKEVMMTLRLALTGCTHGPELPTVIALLGPEECHRRLRRLFSAVQ